MTYTPTMYLPRPDGTKDVFCENSSTVRKPCEHYVTFSKNNVLLSGVMIMIPESTVPRLFCSWACVKRYAARYKI